MELAAVTPVFIVFKGSVAALTCGVTSGMA